MIQDLSGSWCIRGTGESTLVMDSPLPLMHHDPGRSWIIDPDPDHPKGTQPKIVFCPKKSTSIINFEYIEFFMACTNTWMRFGTS